MGKTLLDKEVLKKLKREEKKLELLYSHQQDETLNT
jgi:hypothetical protein